MFVNVDGVIINKKYIGYAYVVKREKDNNHKWVLHVRFMNENQHGDYLELTYSTKKQAEEILRKLEEDLQ